MPPIEVFEGDGIDRRPPPEPPKPLPWAIQERMAFDSDRWLVRNLVPDPDSQLRIVTERQISAYPKALILVTFPNRQTAVRFSRSREAKDLSSRLKVVPTPNWYFL